MNASHPTQPLPATAARHPALTSAPHLYEDVEPVGCNANVPGVHLAHPAQRLLGLWMRLNPLTQVLP